MKVKGSNGVTDYGWKRTRIVWVKQKVGLVTYTSSNKEFDTPTLRYLYSSLTTPITTIDYNMETKTSTPPTTTTTTTKKKKKTRRTGMGWRALGKHSIIRGNFLLNNP